MSDTPIFDGIVRESGTQPLQPTIPTIPAIENLSAGVIRGFAKIKEAAEGMGRIARSMAEDLAGRDELAKVIRERPGREIVRDGLHEVRVWLGEVE